LILGKMAPGHCEGVMKKARFTEEQLVKILRESRGGSRFSLSCRYTRYSRIFP
jgi:hypothetical protein